MRKKNKSKKAIVGLVVISILAVGIFYVISPKHWLEISVLSPIPPVP